MSINDINFLYNKRFCKCNDEKSSVISDLASNHLCIITTKYKKNINSINKLTIGFNTGMSKDRTKCGIHAEYDAISKLKPLKTNKLKRIDIIIVKIKLSGTLGISKPCEQCIKMLLYLPPKKGYKINKILYSDNEGKIIKTTLAKLNKEENKHITFFTRYKRMKQ